jgi:hypothetical protein
LPENEPQQDSEASHYHKVKDQFGSHGVWEVNALSRDLTQLFGHLLDSSPGKKLAKGRDCPGKIGGRSARSPHFCPAKCPKAMKFYGIEALLLLAVVAGLLGVVAGFQFLLAPGAGKPSHQRATFWGLAAAAIPFGVALAGLYLAQAHRPWVDAAGIPLALAGAAGGYWLYQKKGGASPPPQDQG